MDFENEYLLIAGSIVAAIGSGMLLTLTEPEPIFSGLLAIVSFMLIRQANSQSLMKGRSKKMKTALINGNVLYELIILVSVLSLPQIPKSLAVLVIASVAFAEILRLEAADRLKKNIGFDFGRDSRVILVILSIFTYISNPFYAFYGVLLVFLIAAYDSLRILGRLRNEF